MNFGATASEYYARANDVVTSVIDNLIKGASGAAVQNFNLMHGYEESTALFQRAVALHRSLCPGLAVGIKAAQIAVHAGADLEGGQPGEVRFVASSTCQLRRLLGSLQHRMVMLLRLGRHRSQAQRGQLCVLGHDS